MMRDSSGIGRLKDSIGATIPASRRSIPSCTEATARKWAPDLIAATATRRAPCP